MTTPATHSPALRPDPKDLGARARWLAARGRNALRHPARIAVMGTIAFLGVLLFLILLPGATRGMKQIIDSSRAGLQDTTPLATANDRAQAELRRADSLLREVRARVASTPVLPSVVHLSPEQRARRDSLASVASTLSRLITRVENAPLPQTYRQLAESAPLARNPLVQAMLDSLSDIEHEREAFGAVSGVDPVYVALTSRATQIGRTIQGIAEAERVKARDGITAIMEAARRPDATPVAAAAPASASPPVAGATAAADSTAVAVAPPVAVVDTTPFVVLADTARHAAAVTASALGVARAFNTDVQRRLDEARARANNMAPPFAILGAAIVFAIMVGFAFSLLIESTRPSVADAAEAERLTGARVLAIVRPPDRAADQRERRQTDQLVAPDLDPTSKGYLAVQLHLVASGSAIQSIAVTGDDPALAAVIAANIAAVAAHEARDTLLIDLDTTSCGVSSALLIRPSPGTAEVIARRSMWADVITTAPVGRDRVLEVIPAGGRELQPKNTAEAADIRDELARLSRRYDLCVFATAPDRDLAPESSVDPSSDVLLCARLGGTSLAALTALAIRARGAGRNVRGVVLWHGAPPALRSRDEQRMQAETPRATESGAAEASAAR